MKNILKSNAFKIIGIVLLAVLLIALASKLFIFSDDENKTSSPVGIQYGPTIHNGGAYYNSKFSGLRYSFNESDPGVTVSANGNLSLEEGALVMSSLSSNSNRSRVYFDLTYDTAPSGSDTYYVDKILEFDFKTQETISRMNYIFSALRINEGGYRSDIYFFYNSSTNSIEIPRSGTADLVDSDSVITVNPGEWNNFRFVYHIENDRFHVKMFVNGVYVYEFVVQNFSSTAEDLNKAELSLYNPIVGDSIFVDNIFMGYKLVEKTAE